MINIKNFTIFKCDVRKNFHWSKLPKLKKLMDKNRCILRRADLSGADLRRANLQCADLSGAVLRRADLSGADLSGANLLCADLQCADLSDADLRRADLRRANLQCADLSGAVLRRANLLCADLRGAKLEPLHCEEVTVEDFMSVSGLGSCNRQTLIFKTNIGIVIQCGCFYGTEKEFRKQVKITHYGNNYEKEYLEMLKLAKIRFSR